MFIRRPKSTPDELDFNLQRLGPVENRFGIPCFSNICQFFIRKYLHFPPPLSTHLMTDQAKYTTFLK